MAAIPPADLSLTAPAPGSVTAWPVTAQSIDFDATFNYIDVPTPMFLSTPERSLYRAPTTITVTLDLAPANQTVTFRVAGIVVDTSLTRGDGSCGPISLEVVNLGAGTHTVTATVSGRSVFRDFFLKKDPRAPIIEPVPDADPEVVTGMVTAGGVQRWTLQDLMPLGLGSWVMPANPRSMAPIPRSNAITVVHTTGTPGAFHASDSEPPPLPWSFAGYCPDREFYDTLISYGNLNRRFYLIDHRNRAWTVSFEGVEMVPRKRQKLNDGSYNDWAADYSVKVIIYNQNPKTPA